MRQNAEALHELARIAVEDSATRDTLTLAATIIRRATGAAEAMVVYAEDQDFLVCGDPGDGAGTELTQIALWVVQRQIIELGGPVAFNLIGHRVEDFTRASSDEEREFLALSVPTTESTSEMCLLRGSWEHEARAGILRLMASAMPSLTVILDRFLNADRAHHQREQLTSLANAAQVLIRSADEEVALTDLANAIAASTGFEYIVNIDMYDATTDRFFLRILSRHRHTSGTLAQIWRASLNPERPDVWNRQVMRTSRPRFTSDLQNDQRLPAQVRTFFTRSLLRSSAVFPLLFQDEFLGTMSFVSFKPRTFPPEQVNFLQGLATQAATAIKALQMHRELQRYTHELKRAADEYIATANLTGEIVGKVDKYGNWTFLNDAACQFYGRPREELLSVDSKSHIHSEDIAATVEAVQKAAATREPISGSVNRQITPKGTRVVEWNALPFFDEEGQYAGMQMTGRDITDRKGAEEALRQSEEEFRLVFEDAKDAILWADPETGLITRCNRAAESLLEREREEILGQHQTAVHPPEKAEHYAEMFKRHLEQEGYADDEAEVITKSGRIVPVRITASVTPVGGKPIIQGVFHDISARKRTEEALRESEERYRLLAENASDVIWTMDLGLRYTYMSPAITRMRGYSVEEVMAQTVNESMTPASREVAVKTLAEELAIERMEQKDLSRSRTLELEMNCKDGSTVWCEMRMTFLRDPDGNAVGILGVTRDISERKRAEKELRESEERLRTLITNAPVILFALDREGVFTLSEGKGLEGLGLRPGEVVGRHVLDVFGDSAQVIGYMHRALAGETLTAIVELAGSTFETHFTPVRDHDGKVSGGIGVAVDITERRGTEAALRASEERYRLLAENASDVIWTMDLGVRYTYISPSITRMRGYTVEEVMAQTVNESMTPASREVAMKTLAEELAIERMPEKKIPRSRTLELEMNCKDGSTIWCEMNMTFLRDPDGNPVGILGVTRDISERKKAEQEQERLHAELELRAITDSLTGLYDHAHFYQRLAEELERSKRYNHRFAVVMLDVDDFKRFNESRGHHVGDEMLRLVGDCIRSGLRRSDLAFRYGGDEFAAILLHADSSKAQALVSRINRRIARSLKQMNGEDAARLSLSAGVACFPADGITADDLVRIADAALYSAKWVTRARDIMGQKEDIQSFVSALVNRRAGVEDPAGGVIFRPEALHEEQARIVSSVASSIAVALKDAGVSQALEDPDLQIVAVVGAAAEIKDRYIRGHPERTSELAVTLAQEMGLTPERVRDIRIAGLLHDIGKVTVSESILNKPGKLTRSEFANIKDHPIVGATLVSQVKGFERLVSIVRHHHERFDGNGYPDGLTGEDIPLEARILSVADVFDAMTHQRSYRKALSGEETLAELEGCAGTQFDPAVVEAFLAFVKRRRKESATPAQAASQRRQLAAARAAGQSKG